MGVCLAVMVLVVISQYRLENMITGMPRLFFTLISGMSVLSVCPFHCLPDLHKLSLIQTQRESDKHWCLFILLTRALPGRLW